MQVLLISGSPYKLSRCSAVIDELDIRLKNNLIVTDKIFICNMPPDAILNIDKKNIHIADALNKISKTKIIVIATPIYQASLSGILKVFLDLIPERGLLGKIILPVSISGSQHHMLSLEYSLIPILRALSAHTILNSIYGIEHQIKITETDVSFEADFSCRLDHGVNLICNYLSMFHKEVDTTAGLITLPGAYSGDREHLFWAQVIT